MTTLTIEQGNNIEIVSYAVILKLYETALNSTNVTLSGNLQCEHCFENAYDYLTGYVTEGVKRFPNLLISVTDGKYIVFADSVINSYWANSLYGDSVGLPDTSIISITSFPERLTDENTAINASPMTYGAYAFYNDKTITSFNELGRFSNITKIPDCAFRSSSLKYINLDNIVTLGAAAFRDSDLTGVIKLPKLKQWAARNTTSTGNQNYSYFWNNPNMTEIHIGANVSDEDKITSVPSYTFQNCSSLSKVTGLSMVTSIGNNAFDGCSNLSNIDIDWTKITTLNSECFRSCNNLPIEDFSAPNLVTLGSNAFRNTNIKTVSDLGKISSLTGTVFLGCTQLTSFTLPSTLKTFNCAAFEGCDIDTIVGIEGVETMLFGQYNNKNKDFKYVEVPSTVTDMTHFFHDSLNSLNSSNKAVCVIKATTPPSLGYYNSNGGGPIYDSTAEGALTLNTINGVNRCFLGIYVPDNSLNDYLAASGAWLESAVLAKVKPISQLETDSPSSWAIYQQGLSNQ